MDRPSFVVHDHHRPRRHRDLRLEVDGVLRSWAVPKGLPTDPRRDRLAIRVPDHDLDHLTYADEHKAVEDTGWWELLDETDRRVLFVLHGRAGPRRYALVRTDDGGRSWLLHLTKDQPARPAEDPDRQLGPAPSGLPSDAGLRSSADRAADF